MTTPRARSGSRFHEIGSDAYAVLLGPDSVEVSERHPGHLWAAFSADPSGSGRVDMLFVDERGSAKSTFTLTAYARTLHIGLVVDGDIVGMIPSRGAARAGDTVNMDWSEMYDTMA